MNRGLLIGLGVLTVGGIAVAALAMGGGGTAESGGIRWNTSTCMPVHVDGDLLKPWLDANVQRLVEQYDITEGDDLIARIFHELAPADCKTRFPPVEGTKEAGEWVLVLAMFGDLYQLLVNQARAQMEGVSFALNYDPNQALAGALAQSIN